MKAKYYIFDIETNALKLEEVDRIHCLSFKLLNPTEGQSDKVMTVTDIPTITRFFSQENVVFIGHNLFGYDIPVLEKMTGVDYSRDRARVIDTLALSWYLFSHLNRHGLEAWGEELGLAKVEIEDWENLSEAEYIERCETDVRITEMVLNTCIDKLKKLYRGAPYQKVVQYLSDKLYAYYIAAKNPFILDIELCDEMYEKLDEEFEYAKEQLQKSLPKVAEYKVKNKPKKTHKQDGSLSSHGEKWFKLLKEQNLPEDTEGPVKYVASYKEPNAGAQQQIKDWLFSLGWKPVVFKDGANGKVPQIRKENDKGEKELAPCVQRLMKKNPEIQYLEKLGILSHRKAIFKGFIENAGPNNTLAADLSGFTNTLRIKHKTLVNLPGVHKPYGAEIRGCLMAPPGMELVGSDVSGLEDTTKRHYIYPFDPKYVEEQMVPGFDPHCDIAVLANLMTTEDVLFFKAFKNVTKAIEKNEEPNAEEVEYLKIYEVSEQKQHAYHEGLSVKRKSAKITNFSATYGVGAKKLADTLGIKKYAAQKILDAYWKRNWSIKAFAETLRTQNFFQPTNVPYKVNVTYYETDPFNGEAVEKVTQETRFRVVMEDELWVLNPINKFWYRVRSKKDLFSAVNQSTGAFLFDQWLAEVLKVYPKVSAQFHDELAMAIPLGEGIRARTDKFLRECMDKVNARYQLNTPLSIDCKFGNNYAEVH